MLLLQITNPLQITLEEEDWLWDGKNMLSFLIALAICCLVFYVYHTLWLQPEKIRKRLLMQGINGPKPSFFYGNLLEMKRIDSRNKVKNEDRCISHEFKLYPSFNLWRNEYGMMHLYFLKFNFIPCFDMSGCFSLYLI